MDMPLELSAIDGAQELYSWFGYWPSFHDAELLELRLVRDGSSSLKIYTWEMTDEVDRLGHYVLTKHVVVEIFMRDISALSLSGFSHQNVLSCVVLEKADTGFVVTLDDCFGIGGAITTGEISIRVTPGEIQKCTD